MPRSPSPHRSRNRSASPSRPRSRSRSPPKGPRRAKELSFYKKSSSSSAPYSSRAPRDDEAETARERFERRDRGEVPKRFGGSREQGVRNTMGNVQAGAVGSLKRSGDPLDRMGVRGEKGREEERAGGRERGDERRDRERDDRRERDRGGERGRGDGDKAREDRMAAMDKTERRPAAAPTSVPAMPSRLIEVIANDRIGRKVRIKCLPTDTVGDLKRLIAAQTGTTAGKIQLKKWYTSFKDHVTLQDYEINDGMSLEMY